MTWSLSLSICICICICISVSYTPIFIHRGLEGVECHPKCLFLRCTVCPDSKRRFSPSKSSPFVTPHASFPLPLPQVPLPSRDPKTTAEDKPGSRRLGIRLDPVRARHGEKGGAVCARETREACHGVGSGEGGGHGDAGLQPAFCHVTPRGAAMVRFFKIRVHRCDGRQGL